jgi:hypothetical protein
VLSRRWLVWLLSLPLMIAGSEVAHVVAYRLVYPNAVERAAVLSSSGHGYFAYTPLVLAIGLATVCCAWFARVSQARCEVEPSTIPVSPWPFAALPPATFALQEHLERLIHDGAFPFSAVLEPTFMVGLALQLPFALAVYAVAHLLLRAAERVGVLLRPPPAPRPAGMPRQVSFPGNLALPRRAPLAIGGSGRGPPTAG